MLVDTQTVLWSSFEPANISKPAVDALVSARKDGAGLSIAAMTLWEIGMLVSRGRVLLPQSLSSYLRLIEQRFQVIPVSGEIAERSVMLSDRYPKDPTDRLIGATALVHGMKLVTADVPIRKSGEVPCIW